MLEISWLSRFIENYFYKVKKIDVRKSIRGILFDLSMMLAHEVFFSQLKMILSLAILR
jgi:hypothetical protein